jgi:hypothetical protein
VYWKKHCPNETTIQWAKIFQIWSPCFLSPYVRVRSKQSVPSLLTESFHRQHANQCRNSFTRVVPIYLGQNFLSPFGWFFNLGCFFNCRSSSHFLATYTCFRGQVYTLILKKNSGYILGDFGSISSGRPALFRSFGFLCQSCPRWLG